MRRVRTTRSSAASGTDSTDRAENQSLSDSINNYDVRDVTDSEDQIADHEALTSVLRDEPEERVPERRAARRASEGARAASLRKREGQSRP